MDAIGTGRDEDELQLRQDDRLYSVGRALRRTYDADNHDTLSSEVAGLMLDLARVPFDPHECAPPLTPPGPLPRAGLLARLRGALQGARSG